jgi:hypothetical protein
MARRAEDLSPRGRPRGRGGWASSVVVLGLLLFTWPFLRTPLLGIGLSYAHLLGAWALVVVALALLSRALARGSRAGADRG